LGRLYTVSQPYALAGGTPEYTTYGDYDVLNRVGSVTYPIDTSQGLQTVAAYYTYSALQATVQDANGNSTTTTRNPEGLVTDVKDAANKHTTYAYDAFGDAVTITPARTTCDSEYLRQFGPENTVHRSRYGNLELHL